MLDMLNSYLGVAATPELHDVLRRADTAMKKISNYDFDSYYFELMMTDDTRDEGETLAAIIQGSRSFMHQLLVEHGVTMMADTPLEMLSKLLEGIVELPTYGNVDEIHAIINSNHSPIETFSELMTVLTGVVTEDIMVHSQDISTSLIRRILTLTTKKEETTITEEEVLVRDKHVKKLKEFSGYIQREQLTMIDMVKEGMPVGYPFKVYADFIGRRLEQMTPERIAHELYAMALCSVDGINNPRAIIGANINNYIADISLITKVDIIVNDLMVKLNSHG